MESNDSCLTIDYNLNNPNSSKNNEVLNFSSELRNEKLDYEEI